MAGLAALYAALRPDGPVGNAVASPAAPVAAKAADVATARWSLSVDEPGEVVMMAHHGQPVTLEVRSSRSGHFGVHGATAQELSVTGGQPARMSFVATSAGTFPVHFHGADGEHLPLGVLQVRDDVRMR